MVPLFTRNEINLLVYSLSFKSSSANCICFGIGQSWDLVTPSLIDVGCLFEKGRELKISVVKLDSIQHDYIENIKTHMVDYHPRGEK